MFFLLFSVTDSSSYTNYFNIDGLQGIIKTSQILDREGSNDAFQIIMKTPDDVYPYHDGCGTDIQLHSSKGAIGLRIDGVQNLTFHSW